VHGLAGDEARDAARAHAAALLAGVEGDLVAENARLRAERSALVARLAESEARRDEAWLQALGGLSPAGRPLAADGSPLPWSERIRGAAEVGAVEPEQGLLVSGWAVDPSDGGGPLTIVVFVDGRPQACGATGLARPDVAAALQLDSSTAGFAIRMPDPAFDPTAVVRVFALSAQAGVRELDYHPEAYRLRFR